MKKKVYEIDEFSKSCVKELIGVNSQLIYSDRFIKQFGDSGIEGSYFIIALDKGVGVKISSDWFEDEKTLDDYCLVSAEKVNFSVAENSSIFSFESQSELCEISVLSKELSHGDIVNFCDFGLLIQRKDKKKVCIICGESAFRNVVLVDDVNQINGLIDSDQITVRPI